MASHQVFRSHKSTEEVCGAHRVTLERGEIAQADFQQPQLLPQERPSPCPQSFLCFQSRPRTPKSSQQVPGEATSLKEEGASSPSWGRLRKRPEPPALPCTASSLTTQAQRVPQASIYNLVCSQSRAEPGEDTTVATLPTVIFPTGTFSIPIFAQTLGKPGKKESEVTF